MYGNPSNDLIYLPTHIDFSGSVPIAKFLEAVLKERLQGHDPGAEDELLEYNNQHVAK